MKLKLRSHKADETSKRPQTISVLTRKDKSPIADLVALALVLIVTILLGVGFWFIGREFNWRFGYQGKVRQQMEQVEQRLERLEEDRFGRTYGDEDE